MELLFIYNSQVKQIIKCEKKEIIKEKFKKFIKKTNIKEEEFIFIYNGNKIDENLSIEQIVDEKDLKNNKRITILVFGSKTNNDIGNNKIDDDSGIDYIKKVYYKFKTNPNLKFISDITETSQLSGFNDTFEVYLSYKDKKEYLALANNDNDIEILTLIDNKKIISLKGHTKEIIIIRYFINYNDYNEYLISSDYDSNIIVWHLTKNYIIKTRLKGRNDDSIYSCLLVFPHNYFNIIVISSEENVTKVFNLENGVYVNQITRPNFNVYYLLSWYNKKDNNYYLILFGNNAILIKDLKDLFYSKLVVKNEHLNGVIFTIKELEYYYSGFIYNRNENDYLCSSTSRGNIMIWDLYKKSLFKIIQSDSSSFRHITMWNNQFAIVADYENQSLKVIDLEKYKIISNLGGEHEKSVICVKKIYHPIYGESILSCGYDNVIKLWSI